MPVIGVFGSARGPGAVLPVFCDYLMVLNPSADEIVMDWAPGTDLLEAAKVDGYTLLGIWICAVFTFIYVWNDFMGPLIYLHSDEQATLAVALNSFRNQYGGLEDVHLLMAASLVTMIPCILLFSASQRHFIEGLARGAVKG